MKYQILAGTLGLVLLLGMVPTPAEAKIFVIDDFSDDPNGVCDQTVTLIAVPIGPFSQAATGVLGGERDCSISVDAENPPPIGGFNIKIFSPVFKQLKNCLICVAKQNR